MSLFRRGWIRKDTEEISPWVGLSFGALYLATVITVGVAAFHIQQTELNGCRLSDAERWTAWLSRHLAQVQANSPETVASVVRRAAREKGIAFVAVVSADGKFAAHSDLAQVGRSAKKLTWMQEDPLGVRVAEDVTGTGQTVVASRIASIAGGASDHELRIGLAPLAMAWGQSNLFFWSGYVLLVVLGLYLVAYRLLCRSVQPLAFIRNRLMGIKHPLEEQLLTLRLNDSYDQVSSSWNQLIEFIGETQEELRRHKIANGATAVTSAMDSFRSERLSNILMQIPFGVLVVDVDQTITFANRASVGMLSTTGDPLDGTSAPSVLDEELLTKLLVSPTAHRGAQSTLSRWIDHTLERPHGEVTLRFWSIPQREGRIEYVLFVQDVTQAKEAERARDQFLYHVTHELRTPLTNIRAYAETLSEGVIDDERTVRECYNVIMGETQRLNRLVEDILNVSQLEVGTARLETGEVQLDRLIRKAVQDTQGNADAKNIDLVLSLPAKTPRIQGDKERLAVVMTNLVGNAIKYTPEGGRVDVRCHSEEGNVRITVTDTGIGIGAKDLEKIFEKFYRVDDERVAKISGTGLGLAIVQETVRLHGGGVFVESTLGQGSTFTVTLPALPVDASGTTKPTGGAFSGD